MKIAITGSTGLIGSAVADRLARDGHAITRVVRSRQAAAADDAFYWSPADREIDTAGLAGHDVVINLAGENIFGVWTRAKKRRIYDSRVGGTRLLAEAIAGLPADDRPDLWINGSAIGYYGDRPADTPLDEGAEPGEAYMTRVVLDWEAATAPAKEAGVRVVLPRFGLVLDPEGVLLQATTLATRLGLGATIGSGRQAFPWTTRDEIAAVMAFLPNHPELSGPVNVVAPEKTTNRDFADTLARVLGRPRFLSIPAPLVRLAGDLGDEVLTGAWVVPRKLQDAGYVWRDPKLEPALTRILDRNGAT